MLCLDTAATPLCRLSQEAIRGRFPSLNLQFHGRTTFMNIPPRTYTYFVTVSHSHSVAEG